MDGRGELAGGDGHGRIGAGDAAPPLTTSHLQTVNLDIEAASFH